MDTVSLAMVVVPSVEVVAMRVVRLDPPETVSPPVVETFPKEAEEEAMSVLTARI